MLGDWWHAEREDRQLDNWAQKESTAPEMSAKEACGHCRGCVKDPAKG